MTAAVTGSNPVSPAMDLQSNYIGSPPSEPVVLDMDLVFQLPLIIGMHGITPQREFILYEPWLSMWLVARRPL